MTHKLQSSIFLQPIDQHFYFSKKNNFYDTEDTNCFNDYELKLDYLNQSTESDSGESLDDLTNLNFKNNCSNKNLKEKKQNEKMKNYFELEKLNVKTDYTNKYSNREKFINFNLQDQKIPNFSRQTMLSRNNFVDRKISEITYDKQEENIKITSFLQNDWKFKINTQKFLKFSAYKKKILEKISHSKNCNFSNSHNQIKNSNLNLKDFTKIQKFPISEILPNNHPMINQLNLPIRDFSLNNNSNFNNSFNFCNFNYPCNNLKGVNVNYNYEFKKHLSIPNSTFYETRNRTYSYPICSYSENNNNNNNFLNNFQHKLKFENDYYN